MTFFDFENKSAEPEMRSAIEVMFRQSRATNRSDLSDHLVKNLIPLAHRKFWFR